LADKPSGRELGRLIVLAFKKALAKRVGAVSARLDQVQQSLHADLRGVQAEMRSYVTPAHMQSAIESAIAKVETIKGEDGESVTIEELHPFLEAELARIELDQERRFQDRVERAISMLRPPENGKDGASVEDFDIVLDGRDLTVSMKIGGRVVSRTIKVDVPQDRGVYQSGTSYEKSDIVTFAGSSFIAQRDADKNEKPLASPAWRQFVKAGRDGKDAA